MNILICGKNTPYTKNLAERLKREKNEIHYISGSKASEKMGSAVFQQFDFEYTNPNIARIVKSTKAEVMVLIGASDKNYSWRNPSDDAMTFVSGMSSLMMAAKGAGVRKIIYISSIDVFERNTGRLTCVTEPMADSPMLDAFIEVENLCRRFVEEKMEICIMRLPQVTGYHDLNTLNDYCLMNAVRCFRNDKITYCPEQLHAAMHYQDASDAVIKLINEPFSEEKYIYQLQGVVYSEQELMNALRLTGWYRAASIEKKDDREILSCPQTELAESDEDVLRSYPRYTLKQIIETIANEMERMKKEEEKGKEKRLHFLPVLEAVIGAILVTVATYYMRRTWIGDNFNLFILYTLLFGGTYGTTYGLLTGFFSTVGTLVLQWRDVGLVNALENYGFFLSFLLFVLVGVIAGYLHDKYVRKTTSLSEERNYLAAEVTDLTRINDNNIYVNGVYEKRLVGYENSLPRLYEMTSRLDFLEPETIIFQAALVTKELLEVEDVAIYMSSQRSSYYRLSAATSEQATVCGKSFKYDEDAFLYPAFEQREVYKNNRMDENSPSFAGAVTEGSRINAIIMVWTKNLHKVNQYECDMLAVVCRLIEGAMVRANRYLAAVRNENYVEGTRILKEFPFLDSYHHYMEGSSQGVFHFSLLYLPPEEADTEAVQKMTRDTDVLGMVNEAIYILLPFANDGDSAFVVRRFADAGMTLVPVPKEQLENYQMEGVEGIA